ncbi:MAG: MFS transporter, partial [Candidatus Baltobacteraceae bacterium]
ALPILQRDLGASAQQVQWVVEGYSLFLAALLLTGGALGDIFGRRLVYGLGIALFALASVACGLAPSANTLIAARCIQGIGGALATPGSLALLAANFEGEARGRAIGTWSGFSAITAAIGPLLGGWLVQSLSWRAVFFINLPIAVVVLAILATRVDESRNPNASHRVDYAGATFATLGLALLVYGLIGLQSGASRLLDLGIALLGAVTLGAFVFFESRIAEPMMRLELFRSRTFAIANLYTLFLYAALGGSLYFLPFELIDVQGYSPAAAGAALLPFILIMFVASRWSGGLVARIGARTPLVIGALVAGAGFAGFAFAGIGRPYWLSFFFPAVILGAGGALFVAPLTTAVMDAVERERSGLASGINNTVSRAAGLLAIALLGVALASTFSSHIQSSLAASVGVSSATRTIADAHRAALLAGHIPPSIANGEQRAIVAQAIARSYHAGFVVVMLVAAGLCGVAAFVAFAFPSSTRPRRRTASRPV